MATMAEPDADVALLTPVPEEHLISGFDVCANLGSVAFGSDSVMVLSEYAHLVVDSTAYVLFYASHSTASTTPAATYRARFVKYVGALATGKAPPSCCDVRPPSTVTDGPWQSFYVVNNLCKLDEPIPLTKLSKANVKTKLKANFVPLGPLIVATPF
jgi:hypothetical protein